MSLLNPFSESIYQLKRLQPKNQHKTPKNKDKWDKLLPVL